MWLMQKLENQSIKDYFVTILERICRYWGPHHMHPQTALAHLMCLRDSTLVAVDLWVSIARRTEGYWDTV